MTLFETWLLQFVNGPICPEFQFVLTEDAEYELRMLLKELEIVPVGIGAVGLYKFDYAFVAQVSRTKDLKDLQLLMMVIALNI